MRKIFSYPLVSRILGAGAGGDNLDTSGVPQAQFQLPRGGVIIALFGSVVYRDAGSLSKNNLASSYLSITDNSGNPIYVENSSLTNTLPSNWGPINSNGYQHIYQVDNINLSVMPQSNTFIKVSGGVTFIAASLLNEFTEMYISILYEYPNPQLER